jgi:hypothetical protein
VTARPGTMGDVGGLVAGVETARVRGDELSTEVRAEHQRAAWRYLQRRFPADEADELAAILGLTKAPARRPGHCACGAILPLSMVAVGKNAQYKRGACHRCSRSGPPIPVPASVPDRPAPPIERDGELYAGVGHCRGCDRSYRLTGLGRLRPHPAWTVRDGVPLRRPWNCKGSGQHPEEVE